MNSKLHAWIVNRGADLVPVRNHPLSGVGCSDLLGGVIWIAIGF